MARVVIMPKLGLTMEKGTVTEWLRNEGDVVSRGEPLLTLETDKVTGEVEAPVDGVLARVLVPAGETVPVLAPLGILREPGDSEADVDLLLSELHMGNSEANAPGHGGAGTEGGSMTQRAGATEASRQRAISPVARRRLQELGLSPDEVVGTGEGGRITLRDVERALQEREQRLSRSEGAADEAVPSSRQSGHEGVVERPSAMRRTIAARMMESLRNSAQFTLHTEVDAGELVRLRQQLADFAGEEEPFRLSYTELLLRAVIFSLEEHPQLNSHWREDGIVRHKAIHLGVAVEVADGLTVPVIRHADRLGLRELAQALRELTRKAREGRLSPDDMTGSTFTVSNLGMWGVDGFTPILNPPESGILGVGRIREAPVVKKGVLQPGYLLTLSLTVDHRVVDGGTGARFLQSMRRWIEHPAALLMGEGGVATQRGV